MEFGPRALGNRSILANASDIRVKDRINTKIKCRPSFQPVCPAVLRSELQRLFPTAYPNPHMSCAFPLRANIGLPSPAQSTLTGLPVQFVGQEDNALLFAILQRMRVMTGYGVILNTSFNIHGKAIVESPDDAIDDFLESGMDFLVIEGIKCAGAAIISRSVEPVRYCGTVRSGASNEELWVGWGDELMAAGEARRIHEATGGKVRIVAHPTARTTLSSVLWDNIDYIAKPGETAVATLVESPFVRPYRARLEPHGSRWKPYRPQPRRDTPHAAGGDVFGAGGIRVHIDRTKCEDPERRRSNRQWGWDRYAALISSRPHLRWVQAGKPELSTLPGVMRVSTNSFREACAVLARATAYVGPEGGLHHASAALGIPAVVIFGGYISPEVTGYRCHMNLFSGEGLGCGRRKAAAAIA
jgi:hypothetical protein